jgi:hypothetical protein
MQLAIMAEVIQPAPKRATAVQIKPQRAKRHAVRVCGAKGRRYFHIGRRLSWKCKR